MPKTEEKLVEEMCWQLEGPEMPYKVTPSSNECAILTSALFSAKSSLERGSPRRVFVQDLAASLNRKGLLSNEKVGKFTNLGYEYMEI